MATVLKSPELVFATVGIPWITFTLHNQTKLGTLLPPSTAKSAVALIQMDLYTLRMGLREEMISIMETFKGVHILRHWPTDDLENLSIHFDDFEFRSSMFVIVCTLFKEPGHLACFSTNKNAVYKYKYMFTYCFIDAKYGRG